ncbi:hypothetical protein GCM10023347_07440 [Streptomyces chumphonensis]|uniref:Uncharacterized protein n=1 Tax=Streptomyces chumphonensis TaxID=1214925 RepID=A0A927IF49_9ACTN|nr:hypothetical protein [Streptomyces chumphonensis]MBD3934862.1 hypothetical protein [Streptomyces chumphonensis]
MGSVEQIRSEYGELQQQIAGYCEEIEDLEQGELEFNRVYDQLVRSTRQLVAAHSGLPAKLAEPGRHLSERIVRWSWRSQAALGAALAVVTAVPAAWSPSAWWLLLIIPHTAAALAGSRIRVPADGHRELRAAAIALHPVCALVVAIVTGLVSAWWILAAAVGWLVVGGLTMDDKAGNKR